MSPLNRGPLMGPRMPPVGMRPMPPPRFGSRLPPPGLAGIPPRLPPRPMNPMFGPLRQRPPLPPGPRGRMPMFGPRVRGMPPMLMQPMMGPRGMGPRGPPMRPAPRGMLPPQCLPHMRARPPPCGTNMKSKSINNFKKVSKLEELELKKPWMTDDIRSEIVKKNKLYAKAKKNKDAKEWDEFKDLRNKVTRMIRDAKTEYLAKNADQVGLYSDNDEPYDTRDENYQSTEDEEEYYCEVCDREFPSKDYLERHMMEHRVCGIDGCTFSAHEKLVEKHISMQHSTGLYQRMKNLTTPEDIARWIQERKARYPTKANIEQQKAEAVEKKNRSEVIREKKTITENKFSKNDGKGLKKRRRRKRYDRAPLVVPDSELQLYSGIRPFSGTLNLRECTSDTENFDDDCKTESTNNISVIEEKNCQNESNPLSLSLVADYGTDSDLDGPDEMPIKFMKVELESIPPESNTSSQPTSHIPKNTGKNYKQNKICNQKDNGNKRQDSSSGKLNVHNNLKRRSRGPKPNQLLNKLLSRSIQHERNLICQCLKYIMDNKIFE